MRISWTATFFVLSAQFLATPSFSAAVKLNARTASSLTHTIIAKVAYQTYPTDQVFLTGNSNQLCNWKADCLPMQNLGNGVYQGSVTIPPGQNQLELKVTRGSFASEASDAHGYPVANTVIRASDSAAKPTVLQLFGWKDRPATGASPLLQVYPNFYSPELKNSRTVRVLLPASYATCRKCAYPVIYMHDGQNLFDSATANYGVEWNVDETYTDLVNKGVIQEAIIVGLDANKDRFQEYDYNDVKGKLYTQFLIDTVKPWVDQQFKTIPDREHTFSSGSSMGALFSFALIWNRPEVFSKAAGLSFPAFINDNAIYKVVTKANRPTLRVDAYLDHGDYAADANYPAPDDAFIHFLMNDLQFPASQITYRNYPYAEHFEADWGRRFSNALYFLLGVSSHSRKH